MHVDWNDQVKKGQVLAELDPVTQRFTLFRTRIGRAFIAAAAAALKPGGRLWLVANRHLPYEQALARGFGEVRKLADAGGFKVIHAVKAGA